MFYNVRRDYSDSVNLLYVNSLFTLVEPQYEILQFRAIPCTLCNGLQNLAIPCRKFESVISPQGKSGQFQMTFFAFCTLENC